MEVWSAEGQSGATSSFPQKEHALTDSMFSVGQDQQQKRGEVAQFGTADRLHER